MMKRDKTAKPAGGGPAGMRSMGVMPHENKKSE
jgi:hypothetical protein